MPPAGLEPAALCLASSIRLSLTARQSWGCWLDYILDITVPTRIVSEDPCNKLAAGFLRITQSSRIITGPQNRSSTGGSQGVPAYRVVHSMGSDCISPLRLQQGRCSIRWATGAQLNAGMLANQRTVSTAR